MSNETRMLETHEWARLEGKTAVIGLTPYAVEQLGDVVYVELPEEGAQLAKGDQFGEIESVKAASELFAPMSGKVVAANNSLEDNYDKIAEDPFGDGWLVKIEVQEPGEFMQLLAKEDYEKTCVG